MSGKPGKRGEAAQTAEGEDEAQVARRLGELKAKAARAAELIAGLREANHALKGELAELGRRVGSLDAAPQAQGDEPAPEEGPRSENRSQAEDEERSSREHQHLELLLQERKAIRKKIENLLARVDRLES